MKGENKMMVYIVMECIDDEYGCREAHSVYASKADAEAWVAEHQEMLDTWFCEDEEGYPLYIGKEFKVL